MKCVYIKSSSKNDKDSLKWQSRRLFVLGEECGCQITALPLLFDNGIVFVAIVSGEVLPRRRSCVETLRAPSLPLVAPPLGFPRYRAPEGALKRGMRKFGSLEVQLLRWGFAPHPLHSLLQGAKRRAAVAVSGEAAERPMEPEAVRANCCVFAVPIFPGQYCVCGGRLTRAWPYYYRAGRRAMRRRARSSLERRGRASRRPSG